MMLCPRQVLQEALKQHESQRIQSRVVRFENKEDHPESDQALHHQTAQQLVPLDDIA